MLSHVFPHVLVCGFPVSWVHCGICRIPIRHAIDELSLSDLRKVSDRLVEMRNLSSELIFDLAIEILDAVVVTRD